MKLAEAGAKIFLARRVAIGFVIVESEAAVELVAAVCREDSSAICRQSSKCLLWIIGAETYQNILLGKRPVRQFSISFESVA